MAANITSVVPLMGYGLPVDSTNSPYDGGTLSLIFRLLGSEITCDSRIGENDFCDPKPTIASIMGELYGISSTESNLVGSYHRVISLADFILDESEQSQAFKQIKAHMDARGFGTPSVFGTSTSYRLNAGILYDVVEECSGLKLSEKNDLEGRL